MSLAVPREQVPVNVQVVSGEQIRKRGALNLTDTLTGTRSRGTARLIKGVVPRTSISGGGG